MLPIRLRAGSCGDDGSAARGSLKLGPSLWAPPAKIQANAGAWPFGSLHPSTSGRRAGLMAQHLWGESWSQPAKGGGGETAEGLGGEGSSQGKGLLVMANLHHLNGQGFLQLPMNLPNF